MKSGDGIGMTHIAYVAGGVVCMMAKFIGEAESTNATKTVDHMNNTASLHDIIAHFSGLSAKTSPHANGNTASCAGCDK